MRGPCGARLTMARRRANERARPSRPDASHGPALPLHGGACHFTHARGSAPWAFGPMRGACEARLARARCGPTGEVIPAARAPRLGPACRCMAGAPASIAALADAFVMLLNTTRVHVSSRSGHVNIGCVITHMSLSSRVYTSGLIPLRTHVTETRHAGAGLGFTRIGVNLMNVAIMIYHCVSVS